MNNQTNQQLIGMRIKSAREDMDLTQDELGKKLGYSSMGISYFEKGLRKIKTEDIEKLGLVLNKSVSWFLQPIMNYTNEHTDQNSNVTFRRGQEDISNEEKQAERDALRDFDKHIRSITNSN
ncbi:MAG: helix-turn-helix transcriptional regulator [bacterium]|nr:helix-turn-helix transcriptional regulator [bacterium]